jgi:hypothetical protein
MPPVVIAVKVDHGECFVKLLLDHGTDKMLDAALLSAVLPVDTDIVDRLLEKGVDVNRTPDVKNDGCGRFCYQFS